MAQTTHSIEDIVGKVALVDGDILVYRCAAVAEKTHYLVSWNNTEMELHPDYKSAKARAAELGDGIIWNRKEVQPVEFALQATKTTIDNIVNVLGAKETRIYLTGKRNFRDDIAVTHPYKANRPERPKWYRDVREYLVNNWGAVVTDGIEADDAIGIDATRLGAESVIVTNDKDLDQVAGWHFNWTTNGIYRVSPRDGAVALYSQILSGDPTDTVVGIPGIGPVRAKEILEGASNVAGLFERAWGAYKSHFGETSPVKETWNYFLEQTNLVYILRKEGERYKPPYIPDECK